ncbi:UV-stimulated scaffold protein A homolog isoform X2 [Triticum dicoccoides]|uniref:UV-stimulated scaffold protein A homolog isoform X2 n=1 Tax=Triticum dicoccoides TaxID=85692 RepID=UPI00188F8EDD|nr:UV-stimulated scaffold protein A homolog isoform X2 [Triticum dicoccoides]XP_044343044.1 UV-stimulated scaffold protein A homolog isoform X2 [Triticum aestivum]
MAPSATPSASSSPSWPSPTPTCVRLLAFSIVDELFMRSKLFRALLADVLDGFVPLAVGFRSNEQLPPPAASAATLRKAAIQALERWHHLFGVHYRQLRLAVDYLKSSARIQFPGLRAAVEARAAREARTQEILTAKVEQLRSTIESIKDEIRSTIQEIRNGLDIIRAEYEKFERYADDDDEEEEIASMAMQSIRTASLMAGQWVPETQENEAVFDALREAYRLLVSKHFSTIQDWISVLVRVNLADNQFRDSALKEFINVKNEIRAVRGQCNELGLDLDNVRRKKDVQEEDEEDWVEGKIEVPSPPRVVSTLDVAGSSKDNRKGKSMVKGGSGDVPNDGDRSQEMDPERKRLLAEAPLVSWSSVLDRWGSNMDAHVNQRGLELESHWGRMDNDAVIPAAKIAELNVHHSVYKEEPVEILPCHAPLKKGGLCQRRDLKICPFHGPIIPRDARGNPIGRIDGSSDAGGDLLEQKVDIREAGGNPITKTNGGSDSESTLEGQEPSTSKMRNINNDTTDIDGAHDLSKMTMDQLAMQAVKNVRKRGMDDKARERAQRARIRQHNEDVLRQSAIASTPHSAAAYDQPSGTLGQRGRRRGKTKEPTLSSMLKKKVTAKDRIAGRLLNGRARDATIREASNTEDMTYREAFPNQWQ